MPSDRDQKQIFKFLVNRLESGEHFTEEELFAVTTWTRATLSTYWSKQLKPFLTETEGGKFRVTEGFRPLSNWKAFQKHVTQVRQGAAAYIHKRFNKVRIYEFLMPLTHERHLKATLDALFYLDTIKARLRAIPIVKLEEFFPLNGNETDSARIDRVCSWISANIGGYSIYHVNGRFRAEDLATRAEVGANYSRYLVDETTAVARFIFPSNDPNDLAIIEFLFHNLFVKAVIEVVNGEDQIWMVETGFQNQLHVWEVLKNSFEEF